MRKSPTITNAIVTKGLPWNEELHIPAVVNS